MKFFWAIIGLLVAATVGVFVLGGGSGTSAPSRPDTLPAVEAGTSAEDLAAAPHQPGVDRTVESGAGAVEPQDAAASVVATSDEASEDRGVMQEPPAVPDEVIAVGEKAPPVIDEAAVAVPTPEIAPLPAETEVAVAEEEERFDEVIDDVDAAAPLTLAEAGDALNEALAIEDESSEDPTVEEDIAAEDLAAESAAEASDVVVDATLASSDGDAATDAPAGGHRPGHQAVPETVIPDADPGADAHQTIETQEDGRLLIAGQYVVTGSGTKEDPYEVPWELILTARDTYRPRLGKKDIPSGLQLLDGKYIRSRGYMLLPLMGTDIRELLLMRNQWDGCCIGVPPTPYDAIEVKLNDVPTSLSRFRVNFGSVTGKFKVDPYERKDWLLSLYTMEDAEIAVTGF